MTPRRKKICVSLSSAFLLVVIVLSLYAYSHYLSLKKILVVRLSEQASSYVGQGVTIGDITFNGISGIDFHTIVVENPEGFGSGNLLAVKKLTLNLRIRDLLKGKIYFREISLDSPLLSLQTDNEGALNSDRILRLLGSGTSTRAYHIDQINIASGVFAFNDRADYRMKDINIKLNNISSLAGTSTSFSAKFEASGPSIIRVKGTIFLKDDPKKFTVSFSSDDFRPPAFRGLLAKYGMDADAMTVNVEMKAEGDTAAGVKFTASAQTTRPKLRFLKKQSGIRLEAEAFLSPADAVFTIKSISVKSDTMTLLTGKAVVADIFSERSYHADIRVNRIDLSAFNLLPRRTLRGFITSKAIEIRGTMGKGLPEVSGTLEVSDAAFGSGGTEIRDMNAHIMFSSGRQMSAQASASGLIVQAGNYRLERPADAALSLNAEGTTDMMTVKSSVEVEPFAVRLNDGTSVASGRTGLDFVGDIRKKSFSGHYAIRTTALRYGSMPINDLRSSAQIFNGKTATALTDFTLDSDRISLSAAAVSVPGRGPDKGFIIDVKNLSIRYPQENTEIRNLDVHASIASDGTRKQMPAGDIRFSSGQVQYQDLSMHNLAGSVQFDKDQFLAKIPALMISKGTVKVSLSGRTANGIFPLTAKISVDNLELEDLSPVIDRVSRSRYGFSGNVANAVFDGTITAKDAVYGEASLLAQKISAFEKTTKRSLVKDAVLSLKVLFGGEDLEFSSDAAAGTIRLTMSGFAHRFMKDDRNLKISGSVPEIPVEEIRNTFWDIFPDSLLYAPVGGTVASEFRIIRSPDGLRAEGTLIVKDFTVEGEYGKYSVGPVNGTIPLAFGRIHGKADGSGLPVFERESFEKLRTDYEGMKFPDGYYRVTAGSFRYGFRLIHDMEIWMKREDNILKIVRLSGTIFEGRLYGTAFIDLADGFEFRTGLLLTGLSLSALCDDIEPIRGYISGKVDGVATFKGSGGSIRKLIGKADFWSYSEDSEKTKISREFLQKVGGPSVRAYLGERKFDKGIMNLYVQDGFLIFRELEISNRNFFGMQDLSIKVTPFNNRIAIDHLMWTIAQASQRARTKK